MTNMTNIQLKFRHNNNLYLPQLQLAQLERQQEMSNQPTRRETSKCHLSLKTYLPKFSRGRFCMYPQYQLLKILVTATNTRESKGITRDEQTC